MSLSELIKSASSRINRSRDSYQAKQYRFPEDLGAHAIVLNFKEYSYDATKSSLKNSVISDSIVLPLPSNLADSYAVQAQAGSLGVGGALVSAALSGSTQADASNIGERMAKYATAEGKKFWNAAISGDASAITESNLTAYAKFLARNAVELLPGAGLAVDLATGTAINPHVTVNFDGVNLKTHNFTWTFAPKSPSESDTLRDIQNAIRRAILPEYQALGDGRSNTGLVAMDRALLKYPKLCDIFFVGIDQGYFYYFKPAIVTQFEMNFAGGAQVPAILRGGKPALVTMTLSLMETQIHTSADYQ